MTEESEAIVGINEVVLTGINDGEHIMKELEFDIVLEDTPLEEAENTSQPKQEFVSTKESLASLTRESIKKEKEKKEERPSAEEETPEFQKSVKMLVENIVEWCNYSAHHGKWKHVYEMDDVDRKYFKPTMRALRLRLKGVLIISCDPRRELTIEWGTNEV